MDEVYLKLQQKSITSLIWHEFVSLNVKSAISTSRIVWQLNNVTCDVFSYIRLPRSRPCFKDL
jgi:hypothetical protein